MTEQPGSVDDGSGQTTANNPTAQNHAPTIELPELFRVKNWTAFPLDIIREKPEDLTLREWVQKLRNQYLQLTEEQISAVWQKSTVAYLGEEGVGYGSYSADNDHDKWGQPIVVDYVKMVAMLWHERHPDIPINFGDMSQYHGGSLESQGHQSHGAGFDLDVKFVTNDGEPTSGSYADAANYSRKLTQELIELFLDNQNEIVGVDAVYFNDPEVVKYIDTIYPSIISDKEENHESHIHIRFEILNVFTSEMITRRK